MEQTTIIIILSIMFICTVLAYSLLFHYIFTKIKNKNKLKTKLTSPQQKKLADLMVSANLIEKIMIAQNMFGACDIVLRVENNTVSFRLAQSAGTLERNRFADDKSEYIG